MWIFETWDCTGWAKCAHAEAKINATTTKTTAAVTQTTTSTTYAIKATLSVNKPAHTNATTPPTSKQEQP